MSVRRIRTLLSCVPGWSPHETAHLLPELAEEVGSLIDKLDTSIRNLQSVLAAANLGPQASTLEYVVRGLAEEFTMPAGRAPVRQHRGDALISWREMASVVAQGIDASGLPHWAAPAFQQMCSVLASEGFPCIFARQANQLKSGWVCFVDSVESPAGRDAAMRAILAYIGMLERCPRARATIMPLMLIVKPCYPMLSLKEYREQAWGLFQYLHDRDPEPWPIDVPTDPDRGDWSFCFGGIQLFSNVSDPAHRIHKSRNLGDSLVFAMQPRTNFDLVGGNNPKGRQVRNEIRERVERYERQPIASHLGFFGTPENREWLQMATRDGDADHDFPEVCPLVVRSDKPPIRK